MAQTFAGVAQSSDDLSNEIVVRGNSPQYVRYRLEGVEIPNPSHFAAAGAGGGAISMLSSSTLGRSDFYTGAFASEYGNALAGVFDLKFRNGNSQQQESSFMIGLLGIEASLEGPFLPAKGTQAGGQKSSSSYLVNYRYSTLSALEAIGLDPNGVGEFAPKYSDLSFKLNFPTKKAGTFSVFGLAGQNDSRINAVADSTQWESDDDAYSEVEVGKMGVLGLKHQYLLNDQSYIRSTISYSHNGYEYSDQFLQADMDYAPRKEEIENFQNNSFRFNGFYHNKLDARNTVRLGGAIALSDFDFTIQSLEEEDDD